MDDFGKLAQQELALKRMRRRQGFWVHLTVWALTSLLLFVIWLLATPDAMPWFVIPILAWAILVGGHAAWVFGMRSTQELIMDQVRPMPGSPDPADLLSRVAPPADWEQGPASDSGAGAAYGSRTDPEAAGAPESCEARR